MTVPSEDPTSPALEVSLSSHLRATHLATTPVTPAGNIVDMQGAIHQGTPLSGDEQGSPKSGDEPETLNLCEALQEGGEDAGTTHPSPTNAGKELVSSQESSVTDIKRCPTVSDDNPQALTEPQPVVEQECNVMELSQPKPSLVVTVEEEQSSVSSSRVGSVEDVSVATTEESKVVDTLEGHEYINPQGVRFSRDVGQDVSQPLVPYGVVCVRELLRFLISLCNPLDKQNTETMVHMGLTLLTVALEVGADSIGQYGSLLVLVRDEMCRNLFSLLNTERLSIFAADLQVSFLLFESLRTHLKFQLELYLTRLIDIVVSDSPKVGYELREIALGFHLLSIYPYVLNPLRCFQYYKFGRMKLRYHGMSNCADLGHRASDAYCASPKFSESVVQLWRIPGLVTELYLNYDCDLYCPNLFEDLTKLLSKNAFPVSGLYNTHLLSLDALLTIIDSIESHCHSRILNNQGQDSKSGEAEGDSSQTLAVTFPNYDGPSFVARSGRQKVSENIPSHEQLMAIKHKKKLLSTGTEHFNAKPKKGIQFLQEHHLLSTPLDPAEVVHFLRENPHLDKKMIGEFISNRANLLVLDAFVKSFDFSEMRIDEALRLYLETFRLPGESPLISLIMEHFAEHWHKLNGEPFVNADAAFTLAYAVIMLNVDQHNYNVKRQNNPMTVEEFKRNLKKVNGGEDFDSDMLDDIYVAIKSDEIVMPAEQTGLVRDNYQWKVLLRRGAGKDGVFVHAPNGLYDHDLFSLIWGPTVAALSFVFDKSNDTAIYQKAIAGFRKCAMISAHYSMSNDFDNLVISLCKFTTLLNSPETPDALTVAFGSNPKARLAAKTVFNLAHRHGDILRDGWRNVLECVLQLYRCKLLPKVLIEADDFIDISGKILLLREETPSQKTETGLFSSLYSYIALGASEPASQKGPSLEDQESIHQARQCVKECHLEQLITESKFLRLDSLQELVKALIFASHGPDSHVSSGMAYDEDSVVFFLELLLKVVIQNRDRVSSIWPSVRDHMYSLVMGAAAADHHFLMERSIVGLLRLAVRLMRREDMSPIGYTDYGSLGQQVLQSLRMLLLLKPVTLSRVARQIAYGLYELLKTSAANIHSQEDWAIIFTLLACVGAGAPPPRLVSETAGEQAAKSDGDLPRDVDSGLGNERGYTSDSELSKVTTKHNRQQQGADSTLSSRPTSPELSPNSGGGWILVGKEGDIQPLQVQGPRTVNQYTIVPLERELLPHDPFALLKCCESLAFLVRDVAHITPYNFENCVHCIRTFVEATLITADKHSGPKKGSAVPPKESKPRKKSSSRRKEESVGAKPRNSQSMSNPYDADESDSEEVPSGYHQVFKLLSLVSFLRTCTGRSNHPPYCLDQPTVHSNFVGTPFTIPTSHRDSRCRDYFLPPTATPVLPGLPPYTPRLSPLAGPRHWQFHEMLLDLMHTLHTRTAQIFKWWAEENGETDITSLWVQGWCPLLQGIARLCCDARRQVRTSAITYLQRALLVHDLQTLTANEWESCFNKVLFPLLAKLLEPINPQDFSGVEETRMRAATLLSKVFLHHLTPLLYLPTFTALWLTILDFMDKYMHVDQSDLLFEAIPESLKNIILVMDSARVFSSSEGGYSPLWTITWDRIETFLPTLREELFKSHPSVETQAKTISRPDENQGPPPLQEPQIVVNPVCYSDPSTNLIAAGAAGSFGLSISPVSSSASIVEANSIGSSTFLPGCEPAATYGADSPVETLPPISSFHCRPPQGVVLLQQPPITYSHVTQQCSAIGHLAKNSQKTRKSNEQSAKNVEIVYLVTTDMSNNSSFQIRNIAGRVSWCFDSGCTSHMCGSIELFAQIGQNFDHGKLNLTNGTCTDIEEIDTVSIGMSMTTSPVEGLYLQTSPDLDEVAASNHSLPHPPLYLQDPPVSLYSSVTTTVPVPLESQGVIIPSHYFSQDPPGAQQHLFPLSFLSDNTVAASQAQSGVYLLNPSTSISTMPILSPPKSTSSH
uniref:SEC7 domain-containing protein n=1 Tax=Timema douglasi TaxID=61478 RepID=A0A7R8VF36_TIMDO|nr:unnamed protein product [Timema douglasi]